MIKQLLVITICILITSCSQIRVNSLSQNKDKSVDVPLNNNINSGWIISNENEIVNYNYQKKQSITSVKYRPRKEYGDLFFVDEYVGIDEIDFYSGIAANKMHTLLDKTNIGDKNRKISWGSYTDTQLETLFKTSVKMVMSENNLDSSYKQLVLEKFYNESSKLDISIIKSKTEYAFYNIYNYPPSPIIDAKQRDLSAYMPRKEFSSFTIKVGTVFIPEPGAFSTSAFFSVYPSATFPVKEKLADALDRFSIDIGVINKSSNDEVKDNFNDASNRYMLGIGYDIGSNFSLQAGAALWDNGSDMENALYYGISLDLLNLISSATK